MWFHFHVLLGVLFLCHLLDATQIMYNSHSHHDITYTCKVQFFSIGWGNKILVLVPHNKGILMRNKFLHFQCQNTFGNTKCKQHAYFCTHKNVKKFAWRNFINPCYQSIHPSPLKVMSETVNDCKILLSYFKFMFTNISGENVGVTLNISDLSILYFICNT